MSERISEADLNDYVDGRLSARRARRIEEHLERSAEARETVAFLRSLAAEAEALPVSMEPARDLWPEISQNLSPARLVPVELRAPREIEASLGTASWWPRLGSRQWATLAAAALLLIVVSSGITAWWVGVPGPGSRGASAPAGSFLPTSGGGPDSTGGAEAGYVLEIEQLSWVLSEHRDRLDPETVTTIETNLRVIDRAIGRARSALEDDPENPGLTRMLTNNYRQKLELLQRANRIIERSG